MNTKERHPAGLRHHLGRQRQRPAPDARAVHPHPGYELDGLHHRHPEHHDVARGERRDGPQLARLRAPGPEAVPLGGGAQRLAAALPGRRPGRLHPAVRVPRRTHEQRRPVPDRPRPVHEREHDLRRAREPDQDLGCRTPPSSASTTRTATSRRASSRASTARSTSSTTRATPTTRASATRTRRPASSTPTSRPTSSRSRSGTTRTSSGTPRTTGRRAASSRSTTASASTT